MGRSSLILSIMVAACVGLPTWGQGSQSRYTIPARTQLFTGTLSGLTEAYRTLDLGVNDAGVTGDRRELVFLHVLARTGMLVFDREDVAVRTSLLEILEPFGITLTGDTFSPADHDDPDRAQLHFPIDPNDVDRLRFPPEADPAAAADAINAAILPEIDRILAELATVGNTPTPFSMTLTASETGLSTAVEVDYADVLALKAALLAAKTGLYAGANAAYDLVVDLTDPLFTGWEQGVLPETTTVNMVLDAYPNLLKVLPGTGAPSLAQTKKNLLEVLTGVDAALTSMTSETDDQKDDLLRVDPANQDYVRFRTEFDKLRASLSNGTVETYSLGAREKFTLRQNGKDVGRMLLAREPFRPDGSGWIELTALDGASDEFPRLWEVSWFSIDGTRIEGDAEASTQQMWWYGWFEGTISADGSQITAMTLGGWWWGFEGPVTGLSAQRTSHEPITATFDPNPLFSGKMNPRDMLPAFDANNMPIPGTVGHGLGDDATLGGVTPDMTQDDWLGGGYEVYGVADPNLLAATVPEGRREIAEFLRYIDQETTVATKLGASQGGTATFAGRYPLYIIAARSRVLLDSVHGPANDYLRTDDAVLVFSLSAFSREIDDGYVSFGEDALVGPPDGDSVALGEVGMFGRFTGWAVVDNPRNWTALTVVAGGRSPKPDPNEGAVVSTGIAPVYRLWSPVRECHFYTISEQEKDMLVRDFSHIWTLEGIAYHAMRDRSDPNVVPVYRFWSPVNSSHFYTISESERDMLVRDYPGIWTLEGIAFYVFPEGRQPPDAAAVYRFWSPVTSHHFYTISEQEKDNLIRNFPHIWTFEGVAWYAYPP